MSAAVHQSAIRILAAARPADPLRVDALIARHELECAAETEQEAKADPACPPCQFGSVCRLGLGCPASNPKFWSIPKNA